MFHFTYYFSRHIENNTVNNNFINSINKKLVIL